MILKRCYSKFEFDSDIEVNDRHDSTLRGIIPDMVKVEPSLGYKLL